MLAGTHDRARIEYYAQQMEAAFQFMETMRQYPIAECGEALESLPAAAAAAGVAVEFSTTKIAGDMDRIHRLRTGLISGFLAVARPMNDRGWVLKVEDGFRSRTMQKWLGRKPSVFDAILAWTIRELHGQIPSPTFLVRRVTAMIATDSTRRSASARG